MNMEPCSPGSAAPAPQPASFWDAVDGIVVINLDSRPDRWEHFLREVGCHLPAGKLHRFDALDGQTLPGYGEPPWFTERTGERSRVWGGTGGCALSHRNAIALAREKGWRNVLVLEDDVVMQPLQAEVDCLLQQALAALAGKPYMFYLGYNKPKPHGRPFLKGGKGTAVWSIGGALGGHAYIVSAELYDTLLAGLPTPETIWPWLARYRAVDTYYRDFVPALPGVGIYAVSPFLFRQTGFESNITQAYADAESYTCNTPPVPLASARGLLHLLGTPFRRLKVRLNSCRTYRRAVNGGLPGKRRRH